MPIISSYHVVDLKRQNRLKVGSGTDKPKLKVKMHTVWWWCPEDFLTSHVLSRRRYGPTPCRYRRVYTRSESQTGKMLCLPAGRSRSLGQQPGKLGCRRLVAWPVAPGDDCRTKRPSAGKTAYSLLARAVPDIRRRLCTSVKNSECQQGDLIFDRSKTRKALSSVNWRQLQVWTGLNQWKVVSTVHSHSPFPYEQSAERWRNDFNCPDVAEM